MATASASGASRPSRYPERVTDDERVEVCTHIRPADLERLDHMSARRGVPRAELVARAVDALLAQEAWSGGFIPPPVEMQIPRPRRGRGRRRR